MDSLKALDPNRPIREADIASCTAHEADMAFRASPLLRSLLEIKRTSLAALHMSANDPKRTCRSAERRTQLRVSPPNPGLRPCNRIATGRAFHGIPRRLYMRRMSLGVFYFASVALGEGC